MMHIIPRLAALIARFGLRLLALPAHLFAKRYLLAYAAGDISWFDQGLYRLLRAELGGLHSATLKCALITSAATPAKTTADPRWGSGGTTNFSTNQVATGGTSYTGPITLAGQSVAVVTPNVLFRANIITLPQDASGFTNARWAILYEDGASKYAFAFLDLGSDRSIVSGQLQIDWNGANDDILQLAN